MIDSMIQQSAERVYAGNVDRKLLQQVEAGTFPKNLWQLGVDSGFTLALAPETAGGIALSWLEAYPILRGLGYWQVPLPLAETMIASVLLALGDVEVPDGPLTLIEQGHFNSVLGANAGDAVVLQGSASRVPWARHARAALVSMLDGRLLLVDLRDAATVCIAPANDLARLSADTVTFAGARAMAVFPNPMPSLRRPLLALGALARSMMMVGALEFILEQSVQYAKDRIQFGKPIGRNQAIQQALALLAGDVVASRVATMVAASSAPSTNPSPTAEARFDIAVAKIRCGEAATRGTSIAHQTHGAIGFTHEHPLNFRNAPPLGLA